jgi:hypothetical protein
MSLTANHFTAVGFWAPRSFGYWLCRPRLWGAVHHRPVAVRFVEQDQWPYESPTIVRWTYDPSVHGKRLCLEFANRPVADLWRFRWRTLANALWKIIDACPQITFHEVPVDVSDCADAHVPKEVFRFAKVPEDPHDLLPNPYLLEPDRARFKPSAWPRKADSIFFRGAATGPTAYEANPRVAACLAARHLEGGDCKLTSFHDAGEDFKVPRNRRSRGRWLAIAICSKSTVIRRHGIAFDESACVGPCQFVLKPTGKNIGMTRSLRGHISLQRHGQISEQLSPIFVTLPIGRRISLLKPVVWSGKH